MPGTTTTALPSFSHDKHHKTDAAKRKGGMTEVMVMTTGTKRRAKLQSNRHHQQTNTQFFYRRDALPVWQAAPLTHQQTCSVA